MFKVQGRWVDNTHVMTDRRTGLPVDLAYGPWYDTQAKPTSKARAQAQAAAWVKGGLYYQCRVVRAGARAVAR